MSWTEIYPLLDDDLVSQYEMLASDGEKAMLDTWFGEEERHNRRHGDHVVAASLFWKPPGLLDTEYPPLTREILRNPEEHGITPRFPPWEHYVLPLLAGADALRATRPDVVFRVYLAKDLSFLIPDLVEAGCEVVVMKGSSLRHNPGAMWRFLALEEEGKLVTITDSDRAGEVIHDVIRTEHVASGGLSHWRVAYTWGMGNRDAGHYRPILACQFGCATAMPTGLWMRAMVWHTLRGSMPNECRIGPGRNIPIFGSRWPDYGFDEWFLLAAVYPRLAFNGVLTFVPWGDGTLNQWFALDIEYVTWANPASQILHQGNPEEADPEYHRALREGRDAERAIGAAAPGKIAGESY